MAIQFGCFVPQGWRMDLVEIRDPVEQFEAMTKVAKAADNGPWDSIWVFDHFHTVPKPTLETTFECWTISAGEPVLHIFFSHVGVFGDEVSPGHPCDGLS